MKSAYAIFCFNKFRVLVILLLLIMGGAIPACASQALARSIDTPPLVLTPAAIAGVEDGRARFREIYCAVREKKGKALPDDRPCEEVLLRLRGEPLPTGRSVELGTAAHKIRVLIVPGILNECIANLVTAYSDAIEHLRKTGYQAEIIPVSGRSRCEDNGTFIRNYIMGLQSGDERLILVGYSKGAPDILDAVVRHPELHNRIAAVVSIAGAVGGSPIAESLPHVLRSIIGNIDIESCKAGDGLESLRPSVRLNWTAEHPLPKKLKFFSLVAFDSRDGISRILKGSYDQLSIVDPRNDSQVIFYDAVIPGSVLLGYVKADHWAVAMPFSRKQNFLYSSLIDHNAFPREVLLESVIRFVEEKLKE